MIRRLLQALGGAHDRWRRYLAPNFVGPCQTPCRPSPAMLRRCFPQQMPKTAYSHTPPPAAVRHPPLPPSLDSPLFPLPPLPQLSSLAYSRLTLPKQGRCGISSVLPTPFLESLPKRALKVSRLCGAFSVGLVSLASRARLMGGGGIDVHSITLKREIFLPSP